MKLFLTTLAIFFSTGVLAANPTQTHLGASAEREAITIFFDSVVVQDLNNEIGLSNSIKGLGMYKYSLDQNVLPILRSQSAGQNSRMRVVEKSGTGKKGVTSGALFVSLVDGVSGAEIASDHSLALLKSFESISTVLLQVENLRDLDDIRDALESDPRIVSTELDIYYGEAVLQ